MHSPRQSLPQKMRNLNHKRRLLPLKLTKMRSFTSNQHFIKNGKPIRWSRYLCPLSQTSNIKITSHKIHFSHRRTLEAQCNIQILMMTRTILLRMSLVSQKKTTLRLSIIGILLRNMIPTNHLHFPRIMCHHMCPPIKMNTNLNIPAFLRKRCL
jgi:hypothetical protein